MIWDNEVIFHVQMQVWVHCPLCAIRSSFAYLSETVRGSFVKRSYQNNLVKRYFRFKRGLLGDCLGIDCPSLPAWAWQNIRRSCESRLGVAHRMSGDRCARLSCLSGVPVILSIGHRQQPRIDQGLPSQKITFWSIPMGSIGKGGVGSRDTEGWVLCFGKVNSDREGAMPHY